MVEGSDRERIGLEFGRGSDSEEMRGIGTKESTNGRVSEDSAAIDHKRDSRARRINNEGRIGQCRISWKISKVIPNQLEILQLRIPLKEIDPPFMSRVDLVWTKRLPEMLRGAWIVTVKSGLRLKSPGINRGDKKVVSKEGITKAKKNKTNIKD